MLADPSPTRARFLQRSHDSMLDPAAYRRGIQRFIRFRWIAGAIALAAASTAYARLSVPGFAAAMAVSVLIVASNLGHIALARATIAPRALLLIQFISDLVLLTAFLGVSGYPGPLVMLYLFHVVLGALLLTRRDAVLIYLGSVGASAIVTGLWYLDLVFSGHTAGFFSLIFPAGWAPSTIGFSMRFPAVFAGTAFIVLVLILPLVRDFRERGRELQDAERRAQARVESLDRILDSAGAAMMVLDAGHRVRWLNGIAARWFPSFAVGAQRPCYNATRLASKAEQECPTCRVLREEAPWHGEHTLAIPDREPRIFRVHATPIAEPDGTRMVAELVLDVTAEHATQQQLQSERKASAVAHFAAGVAHELNTPLASIAAGLRMLKRRTEGKGAPQASGHESGVILGDLAVQTERCQRVTQAILDYTRHQRSRLEWVEVRGIVNQAFDTLRSHRDLTDIDVVAEVGSGDSPAESDPRPAPEAGRVLGEQADHSSFPAAYCDPTQLQLVLTNILTNAVDAVREARRKPGRIRVCLRATPRSVEIRIRDNGPGVPKEIRELVFEPFFTTKASGRGTGLGLPVAQGLLDAMGGSIAISGDGAEGAEVVIELPTKPPETTDRDRVDAPRPLLHGGRGQE